MYDLFIDDIYQKLEKFSTHHLIDPDSVYAHECEVMPRYVVENEHYGMRYQDKRITDLMKKIDDKLFLFTQGMPIFHSFCLYMS